MLQNINNRKIDHNFCRLHGKFKTRPRQLKIIESSSNGTLIQASLQTTHDGMSLPWNQLRRSRNDLVPRPILPVEVYDNQQSRISSSRVFSFWVSEKFVMEVGRRDWLSCEPSTTMTWEQNSQQLVTSYCNKD